MKTLEEKATYVFNTLEQALKEANLPVTISNLSIEDEDNFIFEMVAEHKESGCEYDFVVDAYDDPTMVDTKSIDYIIISILSDIGRLIEDEYGNSEIYHFDTEINEYFKELLSKVLKVIEKTFNL